MLDDTGNSYTPKVLIVDDDNDERALIRKELLAKGFDVVETARGQDTLSIMGLEDPDLVLLDVMMPVVDGITICREIRARNKYRELPILMLTGVDGLDYIQRAFEAGATDFITKSTNLEFISQRIRYVLRNTVNTQQLLQKRNQLARVQRVAKIGHWQYLVKNSRLLMSDEALLLFGLNAQEFDNTFNGFLDLIHLADREKLNAAVNEALYNHRVFNVDHRIVKKDGSECYVNSSGEVIFSDTGEPVSMLGVMQDISERKRAEARIEYQAFYDSLTDLSNRRLFQDRLLHAMAMATREEKLLAVCFFDLDNFKLINDSLGHAVGDELLKSVAKRLKATMRQGDIIARISGDEFALAVEGLGNVNELDKIVEKLRVRLSEPYRIRGHKIYTTASIGIALFPMDCSDQDTLLRNADAAMYRAKELGGNCYCYYTFDMNDKARRRLELEKNLRNAVSNEELTLYYQPQMDAKSGKLVGFEALARWQHPQYGLLPPSKFIPIAEESGLIFSIGRWVLQKACAQMVQWREQGFGDFRVAVNMTARQFAQEDIAQTVQEILVQTGLDPALLCIEITESAAMKNIMGTLDTFNQLKAMGARLSIDDFGAGQSSMNLLQKLPVDALSIDRSYVMGIADRETDGATAKAIIALAHGMGLRVTAEDVETSNHEEFLNKNNCDELQGNFFSPPIPADQVVSLFSALNK